MKNLVKLTFVGAAVILAVAATPSPKHRIAVKPRTSVTVFIDNGTDWKGQLQIVGALTDSFGTSGQYNMGQVNTGTYTVTITLGGPAVSRTYNFTNATQQVSSSGSVTWNNVSISGTATGSIFVN